MAKHIERNELLHTSYLFELRRIDVRTAGGDLVQRDLIQHPGAALVLPVLDDGSIVLIRNWRYAAGDWLWELPCGTLEAGEDPLDCARRELTEEAGYVGRTFERLGSFYSCPGYNTELIHCYLATDLVQTEQDLEIHEEIEVEIVSDAKARQMLADNEITDGKTAAALATYWLRGSKADTGC